nr:alkaline phosphatase family protein [Nocardia tengchongensis]
MGYRLAAAGACAVMGLAVAGCGSGGDAAQHDQHVLLLSIDGMHESDLADYVAAHQDSTLAKLAARGAHYTNAQAPAPADSFPGMVALLTGGSPKTTGVYYDDTWARDLLPAGTKDCATAKKGAQVALTEEIDKDTDQLDGGQGLSGLPNGIAAMTGDPSAVLDPAKLPVDPATCKPISPSDYLKVNTVFSVVHEAGQRTAWSDKHPAYQIVNGKGGRSVDDLFTPEIDSKSPKGPAWSKDVDAVKQYDTYKADAIVNEIGGKDHSGTQSPGVPAVFGMNFQAVSVTQKLPVSKGYGADGKPGAPLAASLDFVDQQIGRFVAALDKAGLGDKTTIVVTAKHGQSPIEPDALTRVDDKPIVDAVNKEWAATHPQTPKLIEHSIDDAALVWWLADARPRPPPSRSGRCSRPTAPAPISTATRSRSRRRAWTRVRSSPGPRPPSSSARPPMTLGCRTCSRAPLGRSTPRASPRSPSTVATAPTTGMSRCWSWARVSPSTMSPNRFR